MCIRDRCTALAATVGTGNIAGVAGAIAIGGPGAVFWMWVSALLGMCTKFSEVTLAVHFREKNKDGDWVGGPMYYIKNGLGPKWRWLAVVFSALGVLTVFGTGNATQVNTITTAIDSALLNLSLIHIWTEVRLDKWSAFCGILLPILLKNRHFSFLHKNSGPPGNEGSLHPAHNTSPGAPGR